MHGELGLKARDGGQSLPEERKRVHELAQHGGQLGPAREHGSLRGEALGGPEAAGRPVGEGPGDAQLAHQREDVVVLRSVCIVLQSCDMRE